MFLLKKILGLLLQPLAIAMLLQVAGLVLLWRDGRSRSGRGLVTVGLALLILISLPILPQLLGRPLERIHRAYEPDARAPVPAYVVVLGGGSMEDPTFPATSRLTPVALARLVEGVRIVRLHPTARLIVTGGHVFSSVSEASLAYALARQLGVDSLRIVVEDESRDTADQSRRVQAIVQDAPIVLVTSAVHMPRAMKLFRQAGIAPVAAPTAHLFDARRTLGPGDFIPNAEHLRSLHLVMHEWYGLLWVEVSRLF